MKLRIALFWGFVVTPAVLVSTFAILTFPPMWVTEYFGGDAQMALALMILWVAGLAVTCALMSE